MMKYTTIKHYYIIYIIFVNIMYNKIKCSGIEFTFLEKAAFLCNSLFLRGSQSPSVQEGGI